MMEERLKIQVVDSLFEHNGNGEPVKVSRVNVNPSARIKKLLELIEKPNVINEQDGRDFHKYNETFAVKPGE